MSCKWNGSDRPRIVAGRHGEECPGDCTGCLPCPWPHCRRCGREHAEHTCPGCLADVRDDLAAITGMCDALPTEVAHKGVESEAMNLLGPAADPEALGHMRASVNVGRIPADWLEAADDERHPLLVLGTWQQAYAEAFGHVDPARITVHGAASYLDRNLAYAGAEEDVPFEEFARAVAACRAHMERVLHDGEQVETGAPCMTCETVRLQLVRGERDDRWRCPRCKQESTDAQYQFALKAELLQKAKWLTDADMTLRTGIRAGTVREWSRERPERPPLIAKRLYAGRIEYLVEDVERVAAEKGMMSA